MMTPPSHSSFAIQLESHQAFVCNLNFESVPTLVADPQTHEFATPMMAFREEGSWLFDDAAQQRWLNDPGCQPVTDLLARLNESSSEPNDEVPARELSAKLLRNLGDRAGGFQRQRKEDCAIVVPHWLAETGRRRLVEVAADAGLRCRAILDRSLAAACFYHSEVTTDQPVLVLDFLREAAVASLVEWHSATGSVSDSLADEEYGADALINQIVVILPKRARHASHSESTSAKLFDYLLAERTLKAAAEGQSSLFHRRILTGDRVLPLSIGRRHLMAMARPLIERSMLLGEQVIDAPPNRWRKHISGVILIGNPFLACVASPMFQSTGCDVSIWNDSPETVPAYGAALLVNENVGKTRAPISKELSQPFTS